MYTYGNNTIVAEYGYYTLDQAEKIIKEKEHKQKQKDMVDIPEELLEQEFTSWEIDNGRIGFNIN